MKKTRLIIGVMLINFFSFFLAGNSADAAKINHAHKKQEKKQVTTEDSEVVDEDEIELVLNKKTLKLGYTIVTPEDTVHLGITPAAFATEENLKVSITPFDGEIVNLEGQTLLSDLYNIEIGLKNKLEIKSFLWLSLKPEVFSQKEYVVKRWNRSKKIWEGLSTTFNANTGRVQASLGLSKAIIGIFEEEKIRFEGKASWYDWNGAAMNLVPIGTKVRVINRETGVETTTKVVSAGPYVEGRIIDLPRKIFAEIGNLWEGVIEVVVEVI